jgi:hypothetical protein
MIIRWHLNQNSGVTTVAGVAGVSHYVSNPLKLQQLRPLRVKDDEFASDAIWGVVGDVAAPPEPDH